MPSSTTTTTWLFTLSWSSSSSSLSSASSESVNSYQAPQKKVNIPPDAVSQHRDPETGTDSSKHETKIDRLFELAIPFCLATFAAIFAAALLHHKQILPTGYSKACSILLLFGYLAFLAATILHVLKTYPKLSAGLVLCGIACSVVTVIIITAEVLRAWTSPHHLGGLYYPAVHLCEVHVNAIAINFMFEKCQGNICLLFQF